VFFQRNGPESAFSSMSEPFPTNRGAAKTDLVPPEVTMASTKPQARPGIDCAQSHEELRQFELADHLLGQSRGAHQK